jgi:outer membrane immunogenic protein
MRKLLLSTVAFAALGGVALAADLPSTKEAPAYVAPAPATPWTGFFIGAQVGAVALDDTANWAPYYFYNGSGPYYYPTDGGWEKSSGTQVTAGINVGYDYQMNNWVLGLIGDFNGRFGSVNYSYDWRDTPNWDASIRGRLGYLLTPNALLYLTGGVAFGGFNLSSTYSGFGYWNYAYHASTNVGWTIGGGLQYALDSHWSTSIEYRYTDWGSANLTDNETYFGDGTYTYGYFGKLDRTDNRVQVGLTYKFTQAEPVVAKY